MSEPRPLTLLTDYGLRDHTVGVLHGVVARFAPGARVIDISHSVSPGDIRAGAIILRNALRQMPAGIHVAIVDPGVGRERRAVAVLCQNQRVLVGPDNGLLCLAIRENGVASAVDIGESPYRQEPVAPTFHGRDIFCPVAAQLAMGASLEDAGMPVELAELTEIDLPEPAVGADRIVATVLHVDRFGTLDLNVCEDHLEQAGFARGDSVQLIVGDLACDAVFCETFGDIEEGGLLIYVNPDGAAAIAVNRGSAAETLEADVDSAIELQLSR